MKIKIFSSASADLIEGYKFYEKQAENIGDYFLDSLYADIESLIIFAGIHQKYFGNYHRLLSKNFPFGVYYKVEDNTAFIYAVLDCRRKPAWIRKKLQKR